MYNNFHRLAEYDKKRLLQIDCGMIAQRKRGAHMKIEGLTVKHKTFGVGTVTKFDGTFLTVTFEKQNQHLPISRRLHHIYPSR